MPALWLSDREGRVRAERCDLLLPGLRRAVRVRVWLHQRIRLGL